MTTPPPFGFVDGNSGNIELDGGYTASTGWSNCKVWKNGKTEQRAYFQYDTSDLPDEGKVTKVEFKPIDAIFQPANIVANLKVYIGDIIGVNLDGNVTEWNAGTVMLISDNLVSGTWVDLSEEGKDPTGFVNKSGTTDIKLEGLYVGGVDEGRNFNLSRDKCELRVTYYVSGIYHAKIYNAKINCV